MCACTETFVCSKCAGTRHDWRTHLEEPLTREEEQAKAQASFDSLVVGLKGEDRH